MQNFRWIDHIDGSLEAGLEMVNQFYWNISTWEDNGNWYVSAGDQLILSTDSKQTFEAFIYGLSLTYSVIPPHILGQWKKELDEELAD